MATKGRPLPPKQPILATLGETGLKEYSGRIREEFHKNLTGTKLLQVLKQMQYNEPTLAAPLMLIEMMIRSTNRQVKMNTSGHPLAAEAAEYVESCLDDMESTLQEIMTEAASAVPWGWSVLEILYKIRSGANGEPRLNSKYSDGRYGWRDWSPRSQESREDWAFDETGRLLGMWQDAESKAGLCFIPVDRMLHFRFRGSKQNPEGFSFLRPAYVPFHYASNLREIEGISLERDGAGIPKMEIPIECMDPNASTAQKQTKTDAESLVKKIRMDALAGLVVPSETDTDGSPSGYKFTLVSASGKNIGAYHTTIVRHEQKMLMTLLSQFLAFGISQEGSHALGDSMTSQLGYAIAAINRAIDEEITRSAFYRLMALEGYPPEAWPYYHSADVEKQKLETVGAFVSQMIGTGAMEMDRAINDWARQQIGLEPKEGRTSDELLAAAMPEQPAEEPSADELDEAAPDLTEEQAEQSEMLTSEEAAQELGVSRASLHRAIKAGQIPGIKIGNQFRMRRSDIEAMFRGGE